MNRRAFLSTLAAGLAGAALDPERLLWVPGQKTIFIPAIPASRLVTTDYLQLLVEEGLRRLRSEIEMSRFLNRGYYSADVVPSHGFNTTISVRVRQA